MGTSRYLEGEEPRGAVVGHVGVSCQPDLPVEEVALQEAVGLRVDVVHLQDVGLVREPAVPLFRFYVPDARLRRDLRHG